MVLLRGPVADIAAPSTGALAAAQVQLLVPVQPGKVIAVGVNYADHASEAGRELPQQPRVFFKPSSALVGPGEAIVLPRNSGEVHHEAELTVVIGRRCRRVPAEDVAQVVLGYTCANDVTDRDIQRRDGQPSYAKSFDTFCPTGPWIETDLDPTAVRVQCGVNGQVRQDGSTRDMLWPVADLVSYISAAMTLEPGDIILTGTPAGVGPIAAGDQVSVSITGIGTLTNPVRQEPPN